MLQDLTLECVWRESLWGVSVKSYPTLILSEASWKLRVFVCVPEQMAEGVVCAYRHDERVEGPSFRHLLEVSYETAAGPHQQDHRW